MNEAITQCTSNVGLIGVLAYTAVVFVLGYAARKLFTKKDPKTVAEVDAGVKAVGERLQQLLDEAQKKLDSLNKG